MRWSSWAVCAFALCACALLQPTAAAPSSLAQTVEAYEETFGPELEYRGDREKKDIIASKVIAGLGVKHFLLDFIFGKVNSIIDYKTAALKYFDKYNAYKNFAVGLGRPANALPPGSTDTSISAGSGGILGIASSFLGSSSGGGGGGRSGGGKTGGVSTSTEDIPDLGGETVNLDIPGELFGSGFSILNRVTKIAGDVVLNTADRMERFVNSLKPILGNTLKIETSNANRQ